MILYTESAAGITPGRLQGFFVGWPNPPSPATHRRLLEGSAAVVLALDGEGGPVVGFVTAITDGVLSAFIPYLEVLPAYQGRGIGTELMRRMLARLQHLHAIDLICDATLQPFYTRLGMRPTGGMVVRNRARLTGG
jgi:ribosomal protein S18 acetylase RimI-like enzyme